MNKLPIMTAALALMCLAFTGCFVESDPTEAGDIHPAYTSTGGAPYSGPAEGSAEGYMGTLTVALTLNSGIITAANITGDDATCPYGGPTVTKAKNFIVANNTVNLDALTGATAKDTKNAIQAAGKKALQTIPGLTLDY
jgi:hypothetical protein